MTALWKLFIEISHRQIWEKFHTIRSKNHLTRYWYSGICNSHKPTKHCDPRQSEPIFIWTNHKGWCQPVEGHAPYPTDSPTATSLGLWNSLVLSLDNECQGHLLRRLASSGKGKHHPTLNRNGKSHTDARPLVIMWLFWSHDMQWPLKHNKQLIK